jgi:ribonucleoside-diphosphate reductase beta chain
VTQRGRVGPGPLAGYEHLLRAAARLQWEEAALDLHAEAGAFARLHDALREPLQALIASFCVAEAAVAEHLAPFAAAGEGVLAECFAVQAGDERRHARFFLRAAHEVAGLDGERAIRARAGGPLIKLFEETLPDTARALARGERELADAVALYHLVLEGIVFHAGQEALLALLARAPGLPALREGTERVQADERWHIGLGVAVLCERGIDVAPLRDAGTRALDCWAPAVRAHLDADAVLARHARRLSLVEY